ILFLSKSFQLRLRLAWKPELKAFLIGDRNLHFFVPEVIVETPEITLDAIDEFLKRGALGGQWQLLGLLSANRQEPQPGYAQIVTWGKADPREWEAEVLLWSEDGTESHSLHIKLSE